MSLLYMKTDSEQAFSVICSVSYFMLQSNSFIVSFYSIYNNCFPVKLVVLNPLLNAVTYDMASPDWFFALEVYQKINPFVTLLDQFRN